MDRSVAADKARTILSVLTGDDALNEKLLTEAIFGAYLSGQLDAIKEQLRKLNNAA